MTKAGPLPVDLRLGVVGLGYVGLPLAVEFAKVHEVVGYDIDSRRVKELSGGRDHTLEVTEAELRTATNLRFTDDERDLERANVYIVTTPTPIDEFKQPDLTPVLTATEAIARTLRRGDLVVYESTVYPGATEERCVPVLEAVSGLTFNRDFSVVMGITVLTSLIIIIANLFVDIMYGILDPRTREVR